VTRHPVDHADLAAAGYFTDWSVPVGSSADFHLSTVDPATTVAVTRLDRDGGTGVGWPVARTAAALARQSIDLGASLRLALEAGRLAADDWGLRLEMRLSVSPHHRVLLATNGFSLGFDAAGRLRLEAEGDAVAAPTPLPVARWLVLALRCRGGRCGVTVEGADGAELALHIPAFSPREITIAASRSGSAATLNVAIGRIALQTQEAEAACFRIPAIGRPARLLPSTGGGAELYLHGAPTFAIRSPRWDGTADDPRAAPEHYDAVLLHDDDLDDAGWPVTHRIAVPEAAESGVYGLSVSAVGRTVTWPFFVTPRRRAADLAFLVPTFTYLAYADERLPEERFPWLCDDAGHRFARANGLTSLYDVHNDGSGVTLASFRRPLATIRDDYRYPLCGAPHLLPVDLQLLRFLAAQDIRVDLITDAELHREGPARLAGYCGLVTGSHPEYWTGAMLDAVRGLQERGGHLAYLGGNGCYWVTESDGHTIEVRRGTRGIRTWSSESGEVHLATTGAPGGLWRSRGRAEHRMLGVGLAAMGFTRSQPFRRTPESHAADLAWLFDGVGDAPIGSDGTVLGGASGYEIDCRSARWGTPAETVLLAVADGFDTAFEADPEAAVDRMPPIRGEMTLTRLHNGAMTFAAGSVAWSGALPGAQQTNAVGTITCNLLRRFST
jgi:N,N-dimethylformamidase